MPDVPYRPASVIFVDPIWLDVKRPLRLGRYEACACRWRYAAERVLVPHARSEHHRRRPGRERSTNSSAQSGASHTRTRPISGLVSRSTASRATVARQARSGRVPARVYRWPPVSSWGARPGCRAQADRKSTRLNSSHLGISYAVFCLKKKRWGKLPLSFVNAVDLKHRRAAFVGSEDGSMDPIRQFCFFNDTATTEIYTLSLHDALPIWVRRTASCRYCCGRGPCRSIRRSRSEEHTSELQSLSHLVCRLLFVKKKHV